MRPTGSGKRLPSFRNVSNSRQRRKYTEALIASMRSIIYLNSLVVLEPLKPKWHRDLAMNYINAAYAAMAMGSGLTNAARGYAEKAIESSKRASSLESDVPEDKLIEANAYVAHALIDEHDYNSTPAWSAKYFDEALNEFKTAVDINSRLVQKHPTILEMQIKRIETLSAYAHFLVRQEKISEARDVRKI